MRGVIAVGLLAVMTAGGALAETMYARFSAPVRDGKGLSAATVGTLEQGESIDVLARDGAYYRVSYSGRAGYVYHNKLSDEKPEDIGALLGANVSAQGIQLTELEAGGALRGLSQTAEDYATSSAAPAWAVAAVEAMQARQVTIEELEAFQREGGLGEYGEEGAR